jgi:hypothetical protein
MGNSVAGMREVGNGTECAPTGFRIDFCDRAPAEIVCQSSALRSLFYVGGKGSRSPHQVEAEVGPVIKSALSSGHTTSKALEHGEDLVVYLEPFKRRLPSEIAAMGIEPPVPRAVPSPLVPSRCLIEPCHRFDRHLG